MNKTIKTINKLLGKEKLCPYCLESITASDVHYHCPTCGKRVIPSKMELLHKTIPICPEPGCHKQSANDTRCGYCGEEIPPSILQYDKYLSFCLLGTVGSGKSNFLTTMLHEMQHAPRSFPWGISHMDDKTKTDFIAKDKLIYEEGKPVDRTPPGMPPVPQQWQISDEMHRIGRRNSSYSLTIFDGAGEDSQNIQPKISRYIKGSKVLVILIDPLVLRGVRNTVNNDVLSASTSATVYENASTHLVDGLANYIRNSCNYKPGKLIDRDVAVVFTKIDAVEKSFGDATVMNPSPHIQRCGFVKADADAVDAEIRDWLASHNESSFLRAIETNFKPNKVRFFGVSSFGQPPINAGNVKRLKAVMPHRVLDPLIWMLAQEGIIPVV